MFFVFAYNPYCISARFKQTIVVLKTVEVEETCLDLSIPCTESTTNEAEESSKCSNSIGGGRKIVSTDGDSGTVLETVLVENETSKEEVEKFEEHVNSHTRLAVEIPKSKPTRLDNVLEKKPDQFINNLASVQTKFKNGTEVAKEDVKLGFSDNFDEHFLPMLDVSWETGWDCIDTLVH